MLKYINFLRIFIFFLFFVLVLSVLMGWAAFPFRAVKMGSPLPKFCVTSLDGTKKLCSAKLKGHITILFFWGADLPAKKKRTVRALRSFEDLKTFFEHRQVRFVSINVQDDPREVIQTVLTEAHSTFPVFVDKDRQAYATLGIFVTPAVLIVDEQGRIVAGEGYSRHLAEVVRGEVEILLGEKTRAEVEKALHPKIKEKSAKEKMADRYFHMGLVLAQRGMLKKALLEFQKALEINPELFQAHIERGCLYAEMGEAQKALQELKAGLSKGDSIRGRICLAKVKAQQGHVEEAIQDLQEIFLRNSRNPELHYALGELYEQKGDLSQAIKEYKTAFELLRKKVTPRLGP